MLWRIAEGNLDYIDFAERYWFWLESAALLLIFIDRESWRCVVWSIQRSVYRKILSWFSLIWSSKSIYRLLIFSVYLEILISSIDNRRRRRIEEIFWHNRDWREPFCMKNWAWGGEECLVWIGLIYLELLKKRKKKSWKRRKISSIFVLIFYLFFFHLWVQYQAVHNFSF